MTTTYLRTVDEEAILRRFSSSDGLPLVLERGLREDRSVLAVEKLHDARHKLETVAELVINPVTGEIPKHRVVNGRGQWRESQIDQWVCEVEAVLVDLIGASVDPPIRVDVDRWWQDLIAGRLSRNEVHRLARPWPPHIARIPDPIVRHGIHCLFAYNRAYVNADKGIAVHSRFDDADFVHSDDEIAVDYTEWEKRCGRVRLS